jgi:hypothetical protein
MTDAPREITVEELIKRLREYLIGRVSQDEHEDDLDLVIDALEDAAREQAAIRARTSEELPARDREVGRRNSWTRAPK